nr:hypothetical protein [Comamonas koreensis]
MTDIKLTIKTKGLASAGARAIAGPCSLPAAAAQPLVGMPVQQAFFAPHPAARILGNYGDKGVPLPRYFLNF